MFRALPLSFPLALAVLTAPGALAAQGQGAQAACAADEHRQFDFWAGEWEVTANGQRAGRNVITVRQNGCLLHESWTGTGGSTGESLNFYDRITKTWNQVWVDANGLVLRLSGGFAGDRMTLSGETSGPNGTTRQRITWVRNSDGTVRQHWESSRDGGTTWTTAFDGLYRKQ